MSRVIITDKAIKDLRKIPRIEQKKIQKKLGILREDIFCGKKLGRDLKKYYSLRAWPYRIIYEIISGKVWVVKIQHRQGAYR